MDNLRQHAATVHPEGFGLRKHPSTQAAIENSQPIPLLPFPENRSTAQEQQRPGLEAYSESSGLPIRRFRDSSFSQANPGSNADTPSQLPSPVTAGGRFGGDPAWPNNISQASLGMSMGSPGVNDQPPTFPYTPLSPPQPSAKIFRSHQARLTRHDQSHPDLTEEEKRFRRSTWHIDSSDNSHMLPPIRMMLSRTPSSEQTIQLSPIQSSFPNLTLTSNSQRNDDLEDVQEHKEIAHNAISEARPLTISSSRRHSYGECAHTPISSQPSDTHVNNLFELATAATSMRSSSISPSPNVEVRSEHLPLQETNLESSMDLDLPEDTEKTNSRRVSIAVLCNVDDRANDSKDCDMMGLLAETALSPEKQSSISTRSAMP